MNVESFSGSYTVVTYVAFYLTFTAEVKILNIQPNKLRIQKYITYTRAHSRKRVPLARLFDVAEIRKRV